MCRNPSLFLRQLPALLCATLLLVACQRAPDAAHMMAQAQQYQARGEFKSAIIELKNVLQAAPGNGPARLQLGKVYLDTGDMASAEKEFRRALDAGVPAASIWPGLGKSMLAQGRYQQLLAELPPEPTQAATAVLRAQAMQGLGQTAAARAQLEDLLKRFPTHPAILRALARTLLGEGKIDDARALIEKSMAANPSDIDSARLMADVSRLQGNTEGAMRLYDQVLTQQPGHVATLLDVATLHIQAGRYPEAKASLAVARRTLPNSLMLLYTQALLEYRQHHLKAAQEQLQLILRAAPEHMPSVLLMGAVHSGLRAWSQAEASLRKFLEAYPGHVYASKMLAGVLLKNGNPAEALRILTPLLKDSVNDADLRALAGDAYMSLGRYREAEAQFQQASVRTPHRALLHAAVGISQLQQGDSARAIAELEKASQSEDKSSATGVLLVMSQLRNKAYPQALATVERLLAKQGKNPLLLNLRGGVQLVSGDRQAARTSFMQALALDALYFPALDNLTQLDQYDRQPDAARQRLEAALAHSPENSELCAELMQALARLASARGQTAIAQSWLERAYHAQPDSLPPALNLLAFYLRHRDSQKALRLARQLEASRPGEPALLTMLADAQIQAGQARSALESLERLLAVQPDSAETQYRIANVQVALKNPDATRLALRKALKQRPDYPQAQVLLIQTLLLDGSYDEALRIARQVQQIHTDSPLGLKLEGDIQMARALPGAAVTVYRRAFDVQPAATQLMPLYRALVLAGQHQQAAEMAERWIGGHPDDTQVRLYYGSSLLEQKDYVRAAKLFEAVLERRPDDVLALNNLAWDRLQMHDPRAWALAQRAYKLAPQSAAVQDTLGWILVERGEIGRALPLLKTASHQSDATDEVRYHYALALLRSGDKQNARTTLHGLLASKQFARHGEVRALLGQL